MAKTPKSVYIISALTIVLNVIFILIGIFFFLEGNLIIAIAIWILVVIEKIIVIYGLTKIPKFQEIINKPPEARQFPEPTCLIFLGIIMAATLMISLISYSIL